MPFIRFTAALAVIIIFGASAVTAMPVYTSSVQEIERNVVQVAGKSKGIAPARPTNLRKATAPKPTARRDFGTAARNNQPVAKTLAPANSGCKTTLKKPLSLKGPKTAKQMATAVSKSAGKNSVIIKTVPKNGQQTSTRYDLRSNPSRKDSHYSKQQKKDIPTPHKTTETVVINKHPGTGKAFPRNKTGDVAPMTKGDVRVVRKYLQKQSGK